MAKSLIVFCLTLCLLLSACGPFSCGEWENDKGNWDRAFWPTYPLIKEDITIVNSWVKRPSLNIHQYAYFFELILNPVLVDELNLKYYRKLENFTETDLVNNIYQPAPQWFLPKDLNAYDIYESRADQKLYIFKDKTSNTSFWTRELKMKD